MAQASTIKTARPADPVPLAADPLAPSAIPASSPTVTFAMHSDPGRVRRLNEDNCGASPEHGAFVICDGMGGAASGEVASKLARDSFLKSLATSAFSAAPARARLYEAVRAANQAVYRQAQRHRAQRGMGTTLVAMLATSEDTSTRTAFIAHVGDSRCYRLRAGQIERLTCDHSLIQEQIQAGLITTHEAAASPIRNIITRAIGTYAAVEPEIAAHAVQPGDLFLLASDGLTGELEDSDIAACLRSVNTAAPTQPELENACHALIYNANEHGGSDNITVLLAAFA
jgi:serine/threonine protein phosphatase PrpC